MLTGGHYGGHWHAPRCLIIMLWMGGGGSKDVLGVMITMVVVMATFRVIFMIPLTIVATHPGAGVVPIVRMIIVIITTT